MAASIEKQQERLRQWPSSAAVMLPNGRPPQVGEVFRQTDLAASLQYMADEEKAAAGRGREAGLEAARDAFYRGDIARKIVGFIKEQGGLLSAEDLANYHSPVGPARAAPLRRSRSLHLRRVVPGADAAADPGIARRHRSGGARPQQRRLHPHPDRGAEARLRRPRGLLHRPGCRQRAAADPDLVGIRRRAAEADPAGSGVARDAAAGPARRDGSAAARQPAEPEPGARHLLCLRRRPLGQRVLGDAERRLLRLADGARHRAHPVLARLAVAPGPAAIRPASRPASGRA